tara:strand:- start:572 stop:871 length:300 start_codon:yes stop_codon:yes gene_type:complete
MSTTGEIVISEDWSSNDYANIITISAAAISSVLLVVFKSRCKKIDICCGMINCLRDPKEDTDEDNNNENNNDNDEEEAIVPNNQNNNQNNNPNNNNNDE